MTRRTAPFVVMILMLVGAAPAVSASGHVFPESIPLPDGFYPEGIAVGAGHDFYAGSLLDGALYRGDLRTGEGAVITPGVPGRLVAGLAFDDRSGLVWGVGQDGSGGKAFAFDGDSGQLIVDMAVPGAFLNDVTVTDGAAYITDSLAGVFWTIPLDHRGMPIGAPVAVPLSGDFVFVGPGDVGPGELPINLNGIDATPDGGTLVANHTTLGVLYRIDPATGVAAQIDLDGGDVPLGDGIVLHGKSLYVVQNFINQVSVVELEPDLASGEIVRVVTSDLFRVPTTAALFGNRLYLVNARFDVAFPPVFGADPVVIDYDVVAIPRN
jgi:sugar lactone lactonase YvrE